jgi:uncharacterized membrane protein
MERLDEQPRGHIGDTGMSVDRRLGRALGWFSLGLGLTQIASPRTVARLIGVDDAEGNERWIRAIGVREIGSGLGLLGGSTAAPFLWSRVAGDAMDLAMLANAMGSRSDDERRRRVTRALVAVAGVAVPDTVASLRATESDRRSSTGDGSADVRATVTIDRSAAELYAFWRDLENLPRFMTHVDSVQDIGGGRSHWRATGPAGTSVEWDAEVIVDEPGVRISWSSLPDSQIDNEGLLEFAPAPKGRGTEVRLRLSYAPPGGTLGRVVAKVLGEEPKQQVTDDLRRFKQLMEVGEIVRSEGSPEGARTTRMLKQHPGQPMAA